MKEQEYLTISIHLYLGALNVNSISSPLTKWASIPSFSLPGEKNNSSRTPKRATILWRPPNFGPEPLELEASIPTRHVGPTSFFPLSPLLWFARDGDLAVAAPAPSAAATVPALPSPEILARYQ